MRAVSLLDRHVCQLEQIAKVNLTLERNYGTPDSVGHRLRYTANLSSNNLSLAPVAKHQQVSYLGIFSVTGKLSMLVEDCRVYYNFSNIRYLTFQHSSANSLKLTCKHAHLSLSVNSSSQ